MNPSQAFTTEPLDCRAIDAAIHAAFTAEFAGGEYASTFVSYKLLEIKVAFGLQQYEGIVLTAMVSIYTDRSRLKVHTRAT